jgi:uncharacterized damage-inducible protein DinB
MKQLLQQFAEYNLWANTAMLDAIYLLAHEQHHKEIESSFSSLYKTIFHVLGAETVWLNRVHKKPNITKLEDKFNGSMKELGIAWNEIDTSWLHFVNHVDEDYLNEKLHYQNVRGDSFNEELYLILMQVFNHCTYHRGQLVTMLRQAGAETIPNSDFISWARIEK